MHESVFTHLFLCLWILQLSSSSYHIIVFLPWSECALLLSSDHGRIWLNQGSSRLSFEVPKISSSHTFLGSEWYDGWVSDDENGKFFMNLFRRGDFEVVFYSFFFDLLDLDCCFIVVLLDKLWEEILLFPPEGKIYNSKNHSCFMYAFRSSHQ